MVIGVVLVVLEVVLAVLEVTGPQVSLVNFQTRLSLRLDLYSPAPPIQTSTLGSGRYCHERSVKNPSPKMGGE